jgi:hypothetical protein
MLGQTGSDVLPYTGRVPNALADLQQYNPNLPNAIEAVWQPFYDFGTPGATNYPAAGIQQLLFFQVPNGGTVGAATKTLQDTNMTLNGQFPAPTAFLCTAIQVLVMPAWSLTVPSSAKTAAAATVNTNINDLTQIADSGYLQFQIGSKVYLTDAPVGKFPPNFTIGGQQAVAGTYAAGTQITVDFARSIGRYYEITPLLIPMNQNFIVSLFWPTLVPVTNAARIGVILDGFFYRQSQ